MAGCALLKKLRSVRILLPVILVSGAMPTAELNQHPWLHLTATLAKPFTGEELLGTVREVLRATDGAQEPIAPRGWQSQPSGWIPLVAP